MTSLKPLKISMLYTGDVRGNHLWMARNHLPLIMELQKICEVETLDFTKASDKRGKNPYDHNEPDIKYRRGEGGAVQLWDLVHAIDNSDGDIIIKMRTDIWFEESAVRIIVDVVKKIMAGELAVAYLGSDWLNNHHGQECDVEEMTSATKLTPDFCIVALREKIRSTDRIRQQIADTPPQKRRSGNKTFRWLMTEGREMTGKTHMIFCRIWLIRKFYEEWPEDYIVVRDYIQSYLVTKEGGIEKKNFVDKEGNAVDNPMQKGIDWWRRMLGWNPMKVNMADVERWQKE